MRAKIALGFVGVWASVASAAACGGSSKSNPGGTGVCATCGGGGDDSGSFVVDDGGGIAVDGPLGDGNGADPTCPDNLKQIYLLGQDASLHQFDPMTLKFTTIGTINCSGTAGNPNSMGVDRNGIAWVNFDDGSLQRVRVKDAACTGTSFNFSSAGFTSQVGMAFVSDVAGSAAESLYVAAFDGSGVAKVDTTALTLSRVGSYGVSGLGAAELTGTGDARLFAFFQQTASVAPVTRSTGKLGTQATVPGLVVGNAWAFAFWGGDFWLFADPDATANSTVTQFDMSTGKASVVVPDAGFVIVGAGVSTCAPTSIPK